MRKLVLFLSGNLLRQDGNGFLREAMEAFPGHPAIVVAANDDHNLEDEDLLARLAAHGAPVITVSEFTLEVGASYLVIVNGSSTRTLIPTLGKLLTSSQSARVFEMQRGSPRCYWG